MKSMSERSESKISDIDVLVIGGGIAAVFAAIKAKEAGAQTVVMVDKGYTGTSGMTPFAAGFLFAYFPGEDDLDDQFRSMVRGLGWLAQQDVVMDHFERVYGIMQDMEDYGVEFEKTEDGKWKRTAGRGKVPGMHFAGPKLMEVMAKALRKKGIQQVHRTMVTDLLTRDGEVHGAVGFDVRTGEFRVFEAKATVLATGGCWYKGRCPGQRDVTGDGVMITFRAGATLAGPEWGDPANLFPAHFDIGPGMSVYAGEGGIMLNGKGERFMESYNPKLMERSGLRLVGAAFCIEVRRGSGPIYMDMRHFTPEQMERIRWILPLAVKMYERAGLLVNNRFVQPIEWVPAAPIARVGLVVDRNHATNLPGYFACGEAVSRQARIEGITACATSGAIAGESAAAYAQKEISIINFSGNDLKELEAYALGMMKRKDGIEPDQVILAIEETLFPYDVLYLRHEERMQKALDRIYDIRDNEVSQLCAYDPHYLKTAHEARNMTLVAELHLKAAMMRKETRTILREDYPYEDNENWLKWIDIHNRNGKAELNTRDVPIDDYPLKPERGKRLYYMWQRAQENGAVKIEGGKAIWV
ncbi:FAD-dependent oxidoreductase [Chloroflexota bacterium]